MTTPYQQARAIASNNSWLKVFLEARILSRAPETEIADKMGLPVDVVEAYISRHYDVADLLPHRSLVVNQLIRPDEATTDDEVTVCFLMRMAYFGGPAVVDACIDCVSRLLPGPIVERLADFSTSPGLEDMKIRRALALELAERDPYGQVVIDYMSRQLERKEPESLQLSAPRPATKRPAPTTAEYPPPPRSIRSRKGNVA
jgi:hypothetical protein